MKKIIFFLLALFIGSMVSINAQVTIGSKEDPHKGAVLDLQTVGDRGGLILPHVELTDVNIWAPLGDSQSDAKDGMLVFNTSNFTSGGLSGEGVYVWSEGKWRLVFLGVPVKSITITSDNGLSRVEEGKPLNLTARTFPDNATNKNVRWYVVPGATPQVTLSNQAPSTVTFNAAAYPQPQDKKLGDVNIIAIAEDGSAMSGIFTITVIPGYTCSTSTDGSYFTSVTGKSGYIYRTLSYPTGNGGANECWMIDNSREGSYVARYFNNEISRKDDPTKDYGAYYSWYQAMATGSSNPCPDGWVIPTVQQLTNLKNAILGPGNSNVNSNNSSYWVKIGTGALSGYYDSAPQIKFANFNFSGGFWSSTEMTYIFDYPNHCEGPYSIDVTPNTYLSVRCVNK